METESPNDKKCVVITKESVFYVPEDSQVPEHSPSRPQSPVDGCRHRSPTAMKRKTMKVLDPSTPQNLYYNRPLSVFMIVMVFVLLVALGVLMMEFEHTLQINAVFSVIGVLLGLLLGWFIRYECNR